MRRWRILRYPCPSMTFGIGCLGYRMVLSFRMSSGAFRALFNIFIIGSGRYMILGRCINIIAMFFIFVFVVSNCPVHGLKGPGILHETPIDIQHICSLVCGKPSLAHHGWHGGDSMSIEGRAGDMKVHVSRVVFMSRSVSTALAAERSLPDVGPFVVRMFACSAQLNRTPHSLGSKKKTVTEKITPPGRVGA